MGCLSLKSCMEVQLQIAEKIILNHLVPKQPNAMSRNCCNKLEVKIKKILNYFIVPIRSTRVLDILTLKKKAKLFTFVTTFQSDTQTIQVSHYIDQNPI